MTAPLALGASGVSKTFGAIKVLHDVTFEVRAGEIHGLVGQNGSGKSTLIKILTGVHEPDPGAELVSWGLRMDLPVGRPQNHGIAVIHQDLGLDGQMTVLENLGIASGYGQRALGPIDWPAERRLAEQQMTRFGYRVPLDRLVDDLPAADRAITAILRASRALSVSPNRGHQLFILDEPTAYLNEADAELLRDLMRRVAENGDSVIFISHFLPEVLSTCHRVSVLRDGHLVATRPTSELGEDELIQLMLARRMSDFYPPPPSGPSGDVALSVSSLSGAVVNGVDLDVRPGELVGITGLTGSGYEELPYLLAGARPRRGRISASGTELPVGVRHAVKAGMVLVPSDRKREGVWTEATAAENLSLPVLGRYRSRGFLALRRERAVAGEAMRRFQVSPSDPVMPVGRFSGGNQQKLVLAKWLQVDPRILVLDEPTQGVDAGARRDILELIRAQIEQGTAGLMCSADHEQLAAVCNRVLVMRGGTICAELSGEDLTEDAVLGVCHAA
ncbi:sugar ABC transporter ATP-binding protein [Rhabdothermincola salaria]|uniref:sugar ABC transporter ATP-binding protein n=1 Tax=Rhabdothermincola salaria TaxID=2903142 RepID=UPI001E2E3D51|nr:sugar ABC transporter ATP-binding protein [Rhabdothermincola salaria]MCD9622777.1 sugar ABC transporter ATP-binding protein [Rhabdothermincola salaria]